ncbi:MAG: PDZ domain-containing protein [Chitinophagales bacterium]
MNFEKSIVKIFVTKQSYDFREPWKNGSIKRTSASGFIIEDGRIITNAHAVSNHKYIQVRFDDNPTKINVELEYISDDYDLAILKFSDDFDTSQLVPLKFGEMPKIQDQIKVYGFPMGGDKVSITEGTISRIQMYKYVFSQQKFTVLQTDAAINPGNSGGPVLHNNLVVGVAFQGQRRADNIGYLIPIHIVKHFIKDIRDGSYNGIPSLGLKWTPLESKIHRKMLGMNENESGVLIKNVLKESILNEIIEEEDVLVQINGEDINVDGSIKLKNRGRINFAYILEKSDYNDKIKLKVLRNGKVENIDVKLSLPKSSSAIAEYSSIESPTYYVKSGFIFEKLSVNYLNTYTRSIFQNRDTPYELMALKENPPTDVEDVIIIVSVLSDDSNEGYQELKNIVIKKINGVKIKSFEDLIKMLNSEGYIKIEDSKGTIIVVDSALAKERDVIIQDTYNINKMYSEDLKEYFEKK